MLSLRKTYTVASGLKYQFWILLPDVMDEESLKLELQKIQKIFEEPVADNFTEHDISASIGVSVFPEPGSSAKNLSNRPFFPFKRPRKKAAGGCRFSASSRSVQKAASAAQNLKSFVGIAAVRGVDGQPGQNCGRRF